MMHDGTVRSQISKVNNSLFKGILTPKKSTPLLHFWTNLEEYLGDKCNAFLRDNWLRKLRRERLRPNIVIADFMTEGDIPTQVIKLNFMDK